MDRKLNLLGGIIFVRRAVANEEMALQTVDESSHLAREQNEA